MFGVATATWDVHTHTGPGAIDTTPTIDYGEYHKLQVSGTAEGSNFGRVYYFSASPLKEVQADEGECIRSDAFIIPTPLTEDPCHHWSGAAHNFDGNAYSYLASEDYYGNLPNCTGN